MHRSAVIERFTARQKTRARLIVLQPTCIADEQPVIAS
jgi:hypothetical protein